MMKLKSEDRVKILEYKFVFEEEKQIDEEYQEGSADLNYRLSFFRNKLDNTLANHSQQSDRYDEMFMGGRKTDALKTQKTYQTQLALTNLIKLSPGQKKCTKRLS